MIVFDHPQNWPRRPSLPEGPCAHLISSLPGEEGTNELLAFGARFGMKREWLHHRGTYREHFDIFEKGIAIAKENGAVEVDRRRFVSILHAKRDMMTPRP